MKDTIETSEPRCATFADLLPLLEYPGLEAEEAAPVLAHLASCSACRARQSAYRDLEQDARRYLSPAGTPRRYDTEELLAAVQQGDFAASSSQNSALPERGSSRPYRPSWARGGVRGLAPVAGLLVVVLAAALIFSGRVFPGMPGGSGTVSPLFGSQTELDAIAMVSPTEGWAVGWTDPSIDDANGDHVLLMHDHGGVWSAVHVPLSGQLYCISMLSATSGWAGGTAGLLHYDGNSWKRVVLSSQWGPMRMQMLSATDGWAISDAGDLWHYDGRSWTKQALPSGLIVSANTTVRLWGLSMTSAADGWVIGNQFNSKGVPYAAVLLHYSQGQWKVGQRMEGVRLSSISMGSTNDGWAIGGIFSAAPGSSTQDASASALVIHSALVLHYTQGKWVQVKSPLRSAESSVLGLVMMRSAQDGWMVDMPDSSGIPSLLHYNGKYWTKASLPLVRDQNTDQFQITGLTLTGAGQGWAVGIRVSNDNEGFPLDSHGDYIPTATSLILRESAGAWKVVQS